ncbi:Albumin-1 B [Orobanche minor]
MADFVKLSPLVFLLLVTLFLTPLMKKVQAVDCSGVCSPFEMPPCGSTDCRCIPWGLFVGQCIHPTGGVMNKMVDEHPNLCQSHADCTKKGSGSFCARYPNADIEYGWCFASGSEAQDMFKIASNSEFARAFLKIASNYGLANSFLKMPEIIAT